MRKLIFLFCLLFNAAFAAQVPVAKKAYFKIKPTIIKSNGAYDNQGTLTVEEDLSFIEHAPHGRSLSFNYLLDLTRKYGVEVTVFFSVSKYAHILQVNGTQRAYDGYSYSISMDCDGAIAECSESTNSSEVGEFAVPWLELDSTTYYLTDGSRLILNISISPSF